MNEQQLLALLQANPNLLRALAAGLGATQKDAATSPLAVQPHGPGGLLSYPGLSPDIFNAMVMPQRGLAERLPVRMSNETNTTFGILTGQTAATGTEPDEPCEGGRIPGNLKICQQYWTFGRLTMNSKPIRIDNAGRVINRSEFLDHRLIGNPFADVPMPTQNVSPQEAFKQVWAKAHLELFVDLEREYRSLLYTGNPANTAGSAGYIEWNGLDQLITTGYQDVVSKSACVAADSALLNFSSAIVQDNGSLVVQQLTELYRVRLKYLAEQLRLDVKIAMVMRYGLFRALTEVWPCVYQTYRCRTAAPNSDAQVVIDGREQERMRQDMRSRKYLLIDDEEVEVIIDDAIVEEIPVAGRAESDIYFVPLTVNGESTLYWEHFNFNAPGAAGDIIRALGAGNARYKASPDGRFLFHYLPETYWCIQMAVVTWKRLILRTPFLAARALNLRYYFSQHEREFDPNASYYFYNGGAYDLTGLTPSYLYPPLADR